MSKRVDVAVVGGGTAAHEAAVAAAQGGAERVVLFEKAPPDEAGGNARFSHTGFRFSNIGSEEIREFLPSIDADEFARMRFTPYSDDDFVADLMRVTSGRIDAELASVLASSSNAAVHWMRELGVGWSPDNPVKRQDGYYFEPGLPLQASDGVSGGLGQLAEWREIAARFGVETRHESAVSGIHGSTKGVEGLHVRGPNGAYDVEADAVVLAAGGFQANPELRARFLGDETRRIKVRGSKHDTGEVLMAALELGAARSGDWSGAHVTPIDTTFPDTETGNKANRYSYLYGITVNLDGQRFFDEGEAEHSYTYAKTGWKLLRERDQRGFQIFDAEGVKWLKHYAYKYGVPVQADRISSLADKLGIDPASLERTVEQFNAAADRETPFVPGSPDGKGTNGLTPPKSNWACPIERPPFTAYPVTPGITFTFGGLQVDRYARVLGEDGEPIDALYASGDIIGLFYGNYPSCTGQTRNAVFSRAAGFHATGAKRDL